MNLEKAPKKGIMYALYTDKVVYRKYSREEFSGEDWKKNLLELHLFNAREEYRLIFSRRGEIENVVSDDKVLYDDIYTEKILTDGYAPEDSDRWIKVINYLSYDENDLMVIGNYRLMEVTDYERNE